MKLRSIVLSFFLLISILLMAGCEEKHERFDLVAGADIAGITITNTDTNETITLDKQQTLSFTEALNASFRFQDGAGDALPVRADIALTDGTTIVVRGGKSNFYTVDADGTQYTVESERLSKWMKSAK